MALLFAFGTVYFFTAEEGTVWFAAHIIGAAVFALYVLFALDAASPLLCGLFLACDFATRPPMLLACALFALEALRVHTKPPATAEGADQALLPRLRAAWQNLDKPAATPPRAYGSLRHPHHYPQSSASSRG